MSKGDRSVDACAGSSCADQAEEFDAGEAGHEVLCVCSSEVLTGVKNEVSPRHLFEATTLEPRYGASLLAAWLRGIVTNPLQLPGWYEIAGRDVRLMLAALTIGRLASGYDPRRLGAR